MSDQRIKEHLQTIEDDLIKLRDNKFYGAVTCVFEIKGGNIMESEITLKRKFRRSEDLKKGGR